MGILGIISFYWYNTILLTEMSCIMMLGDVMSSLLSLWYDVFLIVSESLVRLLKAIVSVSVSLMYIILVFCAIFCKISTGSVAKIRYLVYIW